MKNVVGKPLDVLLPFVGAWSVEARHVTMPTAVIRGRSVFEWWWDRTFLVQRATYDHPDFPDAISVIGATRPDGGLAYNYFDTRGVQRLYDMTFERGVWTLNRAAVSASDFDQTLHATFGADGNTIVGESEASSPGAHELALDLSITYTRVVKNR
jgi:hypothetical protein